MPKTPEYGATKRVGWLWRAFWRLRREHNHDRLNLWSMSGTREKPRPTSVSTEYLSKRPRPYFSTRWPELFRIRIIQGRKKERYRSDTRCAIECCSCRIAGEETVYESSAREK